MREIDRLVHISNVSYISLRSFSMMRQGIFARKWILFFDASTYSCQEQWQGIRRKWNGVQLITTLNWLRS